MFCPVIPSIQGMWAHAHPQVYETEQYWLQSSRPYIYSGRLKQTHHLASSDTAESSSGKYLATNLLRSTENKLLWAVVAKFLSRCWTVSNSGLAFPSESFRAGRKSGTSTELQFPLQIHHSISLFDSKQHVWTFSAIRATACVLFPSPGSRPHSFDFDGLKDGCGSSCASFDSSSVSQHSWMSSPALYMAQMEQS